MALGATQVWRFPCATALIWSDGGEAVPFDVVYCGQTCRGFAIRYDGQVYAYLNRCSHVPMEMDYQPNRFFDMTGHWLICATHGAMYRPRTGECRRRPLPRRAGEDCPDRARRCRALAYCPQPVNL